MVQKKCGYCHSKASLMCTKCRSVYYCSSDHQKSHWKAHKKNCTLPNYTDTIQELETSISSLSIQEALASLEAAKKEIKRIEAFRELAANEYHNAKKSLEETEKYVIII